MTCRSAGLAIKPQKVFCASKKTFCVCIDDDKTGADLLADYVTFYSNANAAEYYIWFNDGTVTDPAPGGTGIEVTINAFDGGNAIAAAASAAIDAEADFCSGIAPFDKRCFYVKVNGYDATQDPVAGNVIGAANLDPMVESEGFFQDLGFTDGDFEISTNPETTQITCHQTGAIVVDEIIRSISPSVSITFKSCTPAIQEKLIAGGFGLKCTDDNGDDHLGFGTSVIGTSASGIGQRLILHPISRADGDETEDIVFPLAVPVIDSFTYSSENPATITATFRALPDLLFKCETNVLHQGTHSQL